MSLWSTFKLRWRLNTAERQRRFNEGLLAEVARLVTEMRKNFPELKEKLEFYMVKYEQAVDESYVVMGETSSYAGQMLKLTRLQGKSMETAAMAMRKAFDKGLDEEERAALAVDKAGKALLAYLSTIKNNAKYKAWAEEFEIIIMTIREHEIGDIKKHRQINAEST